MRCTAPGLLAFVSVLALLSSSCQKELSQQNSEGLKTNCQLTKITYFDESSGAVVDTAGIYYTNDKISHIYLSTYTLHLVYRNNRVCRINYLNVDNTHFNLFDSISYNNAGKIESLIVYAASAGVYTPTSGYEISYNADGTPASVQEFAETGNGLAYVYEYVYTYLQQNVSGMLINDLANSDGLPISYTSDSTTNLFSKLPAEFIFADNLLFGISGVQFGFFSPFLFSKNNITTMQGLPVAYEKNAKGNITALLVNGKKLAQYTYTCK